jgi:TPR repeat protein
MWQAIENKNCRPSGEGNNAGLRSAVGEWRCARLRLRPDRPQRRRQAQPYAASYFANAEAQYDLARLYLKAANATPSEFTYGARWLNLAAENGQHQAQSMLGQMLFDGDRLPPQRARGLTLLTLACESAGPDETWIKESYHSAMASASESDRATALKMLEYWVKDRWNWRL